MFWQTFFFSFIFNNKGIIKNKLSSMLASYPLPDSIDIYNNTNNLETINYISHPKMLKKYSGYDLRYNDSDYNISSIYNISRYFRILEILKVIESNTVSENNKLDIIQQYNYDLETKYVPNINANNLMNDW
uniref:Uncharacterized protein n=1 Tax=viral metagenome TaxID=1070528 RepID=A0A6C0DDY2_9ZZZZ